MPVIYFTDDWCDVCFSKFIQDDNKKLLIVINNLTKGLAELAEILTIWL